MEVLPGIHCIEAGGVNMYLCVAEDGLTLVDAGIPKKEKLVLNKIKQIGRPFTDLHHILITHADLDHAGSLAAIQRATGAKIYAGKETADLLVKGASPRHMPWYAQYVVDHFLKYQAVTVETIHIIHDGDRLPFLGGVQVIASPGHTSDHHSFYCPQPGILFVGDALNTRKGRINLTPKRITADQEAANRSAMVLLTLAPAVLACGHGRPLSGHTSDDLMAAFNTLRRT